MTEIAPAMNKGADMIVKYAPPFLGLGFGYVTGDLLNLGGYINGAIHKGAAVTADGNKIATLITAGLYALIGIFIWRAVGGKYLGPIVGGFMLGVSLRLVQGVL
jgi:hypothetical protein